MTHGRHDVPEHFPQPPQRYDYPTASQGIENSETVTQRGERMKHDFDELGRPLLTVLGGTTPVDEPADAVRRLIDVIIRARRDSAAVDAFARQIHAMADYIEEHAISGQQKVNNLWAGDPPDRHDAAAGLENPIAPPLRVYGEADGWVEAKVTLGVPYQGPPGCVHGGISALLLDQIIGIANHWGEAFGVTANLDINYRKPTPLFKELTIRGKTTQVEGRKVFAEAYIEVEGEKTVEASALFIAMNPMKFVAPEGSD